MNGNSLGVLSSGGLAVAERSEGERSEPQRSGATAKAGADSGMASRPDPEVVAKAKRRTYTLNHPEYKQCILAEAEAAAGTRGGLGALHRSRKLARLVITLDFGPRFRGVRASRIPSARSRRQ